MENSQITTRFNEEELLAHEWLKDFFGFRDLYGEDSQTIKQAEIVAFNVLHNTFGDQLRDIFKRKALDQLKEIRAIQSLRAEKSKTNITKTHNRTD